MGKRQKAYGKKDRKAYRKNDRKAIEEKTESLWKKMTGKP